VSPFKDDADWLVVKLVGGRLEVETEVSEDVLIRGRIRRVGIVDVEATGKDKHGLKLLVVDFFSVCTGVVGDGKAKWLPW